MACIITIYDITHIKRKKSLICYSDFRWFLLNLMSKTSCKICILWQDTLTRNYFIGAVSQYKDNFLLKGGSLLRAMNEFKPILQFLRHFPKALSGLNKKIFNKNPNDICRNRTFYLPLHRQRDNECWIDKEKRWI